MSCAESLSLSGQKVRRSRMQTAQTSEAHGQKFHRSDHHCWSQSMLCEASPPSSFLDYTKKCTIVLLENRIFFLSRH